MCGETESRAVLQSSEIATPIERLFIPSRLSNGPRATHLSIDLCPVHITHYMDGDILLRVHGPLWRFGREQQRHKQEIVADEHEGKADEDDECGQGIALCCRW